VPKRSKSKTVVVEFKISAKPVLGFTYLLVIVQINLLVFHAAPKTVNEYVLERYG
jgi:hypothetical protein